jgi:hypothetical protein
MEKVGIGSEHHFNAVALRRIQQVTVLERRPPPLVGCPYFVSNEGLRNGTGTPWSKRIALSVDGGTAGGVFEDLANLIETDAGKQGNKLIDGNAVLEILE